MHLNSLEFDILIWQGLSNKNDLSINKYSISLLYYLECKSLEDAMCNVMKVI